MTPFVQLRAETIESVLSEHVQGCDPDIARDVEHFIRLIRHSPRLKTMLDAWADVAKDTGRNFDAFCAAFWLGFQTHLAMQETERLERLLK